MKYSCYGALARGKGRATCLVPGVDDALQNQPVGRIECQRNPPFMLWGGGLRRSLSSGRPLRAGPVGLIRPTRFFSELGGLALAAAGSRGCLGVAYFIKGADPSISSSTRNRQIFTKRTEDSPFAEALGATLLFHVNLVSLGAAPTLSATPS